MGTRQVEGGKERCQADGMALKALQEQLNRLEGCKHCTGVIVGFYEVDESCCLTICDINANYCPNCGRKLKEGN